MIFFSYHELQLVTLHLYMIFFFIMNFSCSSNAQIRENKYHVQFSSTFGSALFCLLILFCLYYFVWNV